MAENNDLGIFRDTTGFSKGYLKEDVDKYTKKLVEDIDALSKKVRNLEDQLEEANDKTKKAEEDLEAAKEAAKNEMSMGGSDSAAREKITGLESEVKTLTTKLNSANITLKKLEEALEIEKKARQSEKNLYEVAEKTGKVSAPAQTSGASSDELKEKDKKLSEKEAELKAKAEQLKSKEEQLMSKEKEIVSLKKTIAQKDSKIEELNSEVKTLKEKSSSSDSSTEFKSTFDLGSIFTEAQKTAMKITEEARAAAEATKHEATEKGEKIIADANNKAKEIIEKAEKDAEDMKSDVNSKADSLDKITENMRTAFSSDLSNLKTNLKELSEMIAVIESDINKKVEDTDKKIDEYSKNMFDKAALSEYIKTLPKAEPKQPVSAPQQNVKKQPVNDKKVSWAMDDLEALTKQVEMNTGNSGRKNDANFNGKKPNNNNSSDSQSSGNQGTPAVVASKQSDKWKNDLAALAKEAEIEVTD